MVDTMVIWGWQLLRQALLFACALSCLLLLSLATAEKLVWAQVVSAAASSSTTASISPAAPPKRQALLALPDCRVLCQAPARVLTLQRDARKFADAGAVERAAAAQEESLLALGCIVPGELNALAEYELAAGHDEAAAVAFERVAQGQSESVIMPPDVNAELTQTRRISAACAWVDPRAQNLGEVWSALVQARECARLEAHVRGRELLEEGKPTATGAAAQQVRAALDALRPATFERCVPRSLTTLRLVGAPASALEVRVDQRVLTLAEVEQLIGVGLALPSGPHRLRVSSEASSPAELQFYLPWLATRHELTLELKPLAEPAAPAPTAAPPRSPARRKTAPASVPLVEDRANNSRTLAHTSFALAGASLLASAVFLGLALDAANDAKDECKSTDNCDPSLKRRVDGGVKQARFSEGFLGASLALGGLGAYFNWGTSF